MKSNTFAELLNQNYFQIEKNRFQKILSGIRQHEYCNRPLFPDARMGGEATAEQTAYLIYVAALNLNPFASNFHRSIPKVYTLRDESGKYFADELARLLSNVEELSGCGLQRISFSLDRDSIVFVFREPFYHESLKEYPDVKNFVARETDLVFGSRGELSHERFSILKFSALREIASMLTQTQTILQP